MKKLKQVWRHGLPLLLALAMCLSLVQVPAFAAEEEPPYEEAPACVCEAYCTEEAVNSSCPVCSENTGLCQGEVPESPEDEEVFPEHEHSFEVLEVISDPTCTETGEQRLACSICGMETTEAIPAVGHREAVDKAVEPTETAPGLTEGTHCEVCETVLVKQEEIPAAGTVEPEIPAEVLAFLDAVDALYDLAEIDDAEAMLSAVNEAEELYDALTWEQTGLPEVRERREALDAFWDVVTLEEDVTDAGVTTEEALRAAVANGGEVKLDGDIDLTSTLEIRSTVTLDLNGKTLNGGKKDFFIIKVTGEGTEFTLKDSSGETEDIIVSNSLDSDTIICDKGKVTGGDANWRNGGGVYVDENATFIMTSGTIIGNKARSGSGVYVCGRFEMTGGTIANNNSWDTMTDCGGGVAVRGENASFSMTGGKITGNTGRCGGGVNIYGGASFEMTAPAEISRNTANVHNAGWGGGVYVEWGSFLMHSGTISGNAAQNWGGGIVVSGQAKDWVPIPDKLGTFLMEDGTISGNAAKQGGGGVDIDRSNAEFTMTGGRITNNTAKNGGGVNLEESANFIMTGGTISGNTATQNGGGVCLETDDANKFTMSSDAVISGNTAKDGGGVYVMRNALFEMSGGTITGNSAKPTDGLHGGGGVYSAGSFTMSGGTIVKNEAFKDGWGCGGGVCADGNDASFDMQGGSICENSADIGAGAAVLDCPSPMTISGNANISENTATSTGGGIYVRYSKLTVASGTIDKNKADLYGGGIATFFGDIDLQNGSISENTTGIIGGGISTNGPGVFTMAGGVISNNRATGNTSFRGFGGGVAIGECIIWWPGDKPIDYASALAIEPVDSMKFTMTGGTISGNTADYGGGVDINICDGGKSGEGDNHWGSGIFEMTGGSITNNEAKIFGGGIANEGGLFRMSGSSSITGNKAEQGGALYNRTLGVQADEVTGQIGSTASIEGGTITGNTAAQQGGGVYIEADSEFVMASAQLHNNLATRCGDDVFGQTGGTISLPNISVRNWKLDGKDGNCTHGISGWFYDGAGDDATARWNSLVNGQLCMGESRGAEHVSKFTDFDSAKPLTESLALKAAHGILCKLTVKYVDEQGKEISSTFTEQEKGSGYTVTPEAPDGYVIKEVRGEKTGTLDADKEIVVICCQPRVKVTWKDGYTDTPVLEREIPKDTTEVGEHPTDPTRPGYTFTGWGDPVTDEDGNITITAQWVKLHTVTYTDGVPGEEVFADQVFTRRPGEADPDFEGTPVRPGYRFVGWVRTEDGDGNIVYTAQWRRNTAPSGGGNAGGSTGGTTGGTTTIPDTQTPLDPGTTIIDQEVPLAGAVGLNDADHFAYVIGYEDGTVRPLNNISRAEVATIFFRLMTDDYRQANWSTVNSFTDVKEGDWYNNAISTCARAGALKGRGDGSVFDPNANITRAEFAVIAARFLDSSYVDDGKGDFADTADHWAAKEIRLAAKAGWVNGNGNTFNPDAYITRAEVMTIVNRMLDRTPDKDHMLPDMKKWTDNPEDAWYYEAVQEATNEHDYTRDETAVESWTLVKEHRDWAALELGWAANGGAAAPQGETETQGLPDGI